MKRQLFFLGMMAIFAAISVSVTSCSKDKSDATADMTNKNYTIGGSDVALEITTTCDGVYERYAYVTPAEGDSYWRWKRYEDEEFVFDIDMQWILPEISCVEVINENSFKVFYTDGTDVQVNNVSSDGSFSTTQILANNDSVMTVNFTFPFDLDLMGAVSYMALFGADGPGDNYSQAFPWVVVYGAVLLAVCIYDGVVSIRCERGMANAAEICNNAGCKANKGTCSLRCIRKDDTPANVNCSNYDWSDAPND